jgi:hypothetical protein
MQTYRHADEFGALISPRVAAALAQAGVRHGGFGDVFFSQAEATTAAGRHSREARAS